MDIDGKISLAGQDDIQFPLLYICYNFRHAGNALRTANYKGHFPMAFMPLFCQMHCPTFTRTIWHPINGHCLMEVFLSVVFPLIGAPTIGERGRKNERPSPKGKQLW